VDIRLSGLEAVECGLHRRLLPRVIARGDPADRPVLPHPVVLRAGRVRAERGRVRDALDPGLGDGAEKPRAAADVHALEVCTVTRRLDQPGEVDDGVCSAEEARQIVRFAVRTRPLRGRKRIRLGKPASDADDLVLRRRERAKQARSDVAGGADDDDAHTG